MALNSQDTLANRVTERYRAERGEEIHPYHAALRMLGDASLPTATSSFGEADAQLAVDYLVSQPNNATGAELARAFINAAPDNPAVRETVARGVERLLNEQVGTQDIFARVTCPREQLSRFDEALRGRIDACSDRLQQLTADGQLAANAPELAQARRDTLLAIEQLGRLREENYPNYVPWVIAPEPGPDGRMLQRAWNPAQRLHEIAIKELERGRPEVAAMALEVLAVQIRELRDAEPPPTGDKRPKDQWTKDSMREVFKLVDRAKSEASVVMRVAETSGNAQSRLVATQKMQAYLTVVDAGLMSIVQANRVRSCLTPLVKFVDTLKPTLGMRVPTWVPLGPLRTLLDFVPVGLVTGALGGLVGGPEHDVVTRRVRMSAAKALWKALSAAYFNSYEDPAYRLRDFRQPGPFGRIAGRRDLASRMTRFMVDPDPSVRAYARYANGRQGSDQNKARIGLLANIHEFLGGGWSREVDQLGLGRKLIHGVSYVARWPLSPVLRRWFGTPLLITGVEMPHTEPEMDERGVLRKRKRH